MPVIPFAFQCTIPEHKLLALKDSNNENLESASISNIPGIKYYLRFYANKLKHENGRTWIGLCLELGKYKKVKADYTVFIESANYSEKYHFVYEESFCRGGAVCTTEDFFNSKNNFIVDEKCIIKIRGIFKFETGNAPTSNVEQQKWDGAELGNELLEEADKDFIIVVDEKELKVHKLFLRTRSDVFKAMFNPNTKEAIEHKVEIPDFTFDVVEVAVKMIYNCKFTSSLDLEEMMSLLKFFDKYQIPSLKEKVELILINKISAATVCLLTNASLLSNSIQLKKKCMEFLEKSFASKTPLSDIEILDNDVLKKVVQNLVYHTSGI